MFNKTVIALAASIVILVSATVFNAATQRALPGASLDSVKTSLEETQFAHTSDSTARAEMSLKFAQNRLIEIQRLVEAQQDGELATATQALNSQLTETTPQMESVTDPAMTATPNTDLAFMVTEQVKIRGSLSVGSSETIFSPTTDAGNSSSGDTTTGTNMPATTTTTLTNPNPSNTSDSTSSYDNSNGSNNDGDDSEDKNEKEDENEHEHGDENGDHH
ncbi:MAG: hypothetical protein H6636_05170 [Anaerolineales bacterium]|nr:hypothetical protein [Anaerolineales bacterium]